MTITCFLVVTSLISFSFSTFYHAVIILKVILSLSTLRYCPESSFYFVFNALQIITSYFKKGQLKDYVITYNICSSSQLFTDPALELCGHTEKQFELKSTKSPQYTYDLFIVVVVSIIYYYQHIVLTKWINFRDSSHIIYVIMYNTLWLRRLRRFHICNIDFPSRKGDGDLRYALIILR